MIIFIGILLILWLTPVLEYSGLGLLYVSALSRGNDSQYERVNTLFTRWMAKAYGMGFLGTYGIQDGRILCYTACDDDLVENLQNVKKAISANIKYLLTND